MCEFDSSDGAEHYGFTQPKARKRHTCEDCGGAINPGETYVRAWWTYEGDFSAAKCCLACDAANEDFKEHHEAGMFPGGIREAIAECFRENVEGGGGGWMKWGRHLVAMKRRQIAAREAGAV